MVSSFFMSLSRTGIEKKNKRVAEKKKLKHFSKAKKNFYNAFQNTTQQSRFRRTLFLWADIL